MLKLKCTNCGVDILHTTFEKHDGLCATCHRRKKQDEENERFISTSGCPNCDGSRYISFSWEKVISKENNKFNKYIKHIIPVKNLKHGVLYECSNCHINWWLDNINQSMHLITQDRIPVLEQWNLKRYKITIGNLVQLSKIKNTENYIFPCSVVTKNNIHYAKSLIQLTNSLPLGFVA